MHKLQKLLFNRNFILVLSVVLGILASEGAQYLQELTLYILAFVMTFSLSGIRTKAFFPIKKMIKPMLIGAFLNYVVFGLIILFFAWIIVPDKTLFYGFVIIAAAPPGVAVVPFSYVLKGDVNYSIIGVLGAFLASVFLAPLLMNVFLDEPNISTFSLFVLMLKLVILPLFLSRLLQVNVVDKYVGKIRGRVVDFGFAIIIYTAVGMNREVFFSDFRVLLQIFLTLFLATFVSGEVFTFFMKKTSVDRKKLITQNMLLTIKSSGFSVVTAYIVLGKEAAVPSAVLSVVVLLYLLFLSFKAEITK